MREPARRNDRQPRPAKRRCLTTQLFLTPATSCHELPVRRYLAAATIYQNPDRQEIAFNATGVMLYLITETFLRVPGISFFFFHDLFEIAVRVLEFSMRFAIAGVRLGIYIDMFFRLKASLLFPSRYVLGFIARYRVFGDTFGDFVVECTVVHVPGCFEYLLLAPLFRVKMATLLDLGIFSPGRGLFDRRYG